MTDWLTEMLEANRRFRNRIDPDRLPLEGPAGRVVVTCMDPRVNLAAIGIDEFAADGWNDSRVAVVRTAGARVDRRSLFIGLFGAGVTEVVIVGHTECAVVAAHAEPERLVEAAGLGSPGGEVGSDLLPDGTDRDALRRWLGTAPSPEALVAEELQAIRTLPYAPADLAVYGLVYDVATGEVEPVTLPHDDVIAPSGS